MKTFRIPALAIAGLLIPVLAMAATPDFAQTVRDFSANRHQLIQELSTKLNRPLPPAVEPFFQAAIAGDWASVSNLYAQLKSKGECQTAPPELQNELWAPIHETFGLYEVWTGSKEDSNLISMFAEPILASMPAGSIYFGGTDAGRFAVTAVNDLQSPPPAFCLTQNGLADNSYMAYLRAVYGDRIWLPSAKDSNAAFQQYVDDVNAGRIPAGAEVSVTNGKVQVQGVAGVMMINSMLAQLIFDHNKQAHPVFVEESYVLDWMYPYLQPAGLIMKLNPEPLPELPPETIAADQQFWAGEEAKLAATPGFESNAEARKLFSKLRAASAGIYDFRKLDAAAEAAYRQAIRLYPASPEASFRLAQMLAGRQRLDEASAVLNAFLAVAPAGSAEKAREYLESLNRLKEHNARPENAANPLPGSQAFEK